jgi:hypothetical protein
VGYGGSHDLPEEGALIVIISLALGRRGLDCKGFSLAADRDLLACYFLKELLRKSVDLYKLSWKSFHWLTQFEGKKIIFTTRNYIMTNVVEFDILM